MNWNDYEAAWKRQPLPIGANADAADLRATYETKSRKMAAAIQVRDYAEAGAGLVVAVAYVFFWWQVGRDGWPMAFALALILGLSGFFVRERIRARRLRLGPDAALLVKVGADIAELRRQCHLLSLVWAWYLAPCAGAIAIHFWVIIRRTPSWSPLREPLVIAGFGGFFVLILGLVWMMNRRALRKQLEPRLAELEKLRDDLLEQDDDEAAAPVLTRR
jgi:hypothetical protein